MKNMLLAKVSLFIFAFALCFNFSYAQELSKADAKKWKKIAKDYTKNPGQLKQLSEEHRELKRSASQKEAELASLKQSSVEKDRRLNMLQNEMNQLRARLADAQSTVQERPSPVVNQQPTMVQDESGILFKVQIGAYEDRRIDDEYSNVDNLSVEGDIIQKVLIGKFRNYDDAERLKTQLRGMGLSDAWVVSYRDGARVPIDEVRND